MPSIEEFQQLKASIDTAERELAAATSRKEEIARQLEQLLGELRVASIEEAKTKLHEMRLKMKTAADSILADAEKLGLVKSAKPS